jgi:hypothetical protein
MSVRMILSYTVEPVNVDERDELIEKYGDKVLYENKSDIYGCCIKLLTDNEDTKNRWQENFYFISQNIRSHGRLYALTDPSIEKMKVQYDAFTKTLFLLNCDYYGWTKSLALAIAGDVLEDEHQIYHVHGAAVDFNGTGVSIIAPSNTGKSTHSYGLLRQPETRLISDDWYFVRLMDEDAVVFGSEKNFYIRIDIGDIWTEYKQLVEKAHFDNKERAVVNLRWVVGKGRIRTETTMKKVILLERDPKDPRIVAEMTPDEALEYLVDHDFCNPHQLVKDERKLRLRKDFFRQYLSKVDTYLVNTVRPPLETHKRILQLLKEGKTDHGQ